MELFVQLQNLISENGDVHVSAPLSRTEQQSQRQREIVLWSYRTTREIYIYIIYNYTVLIKFASLIIIIVFIVLIMQFSIR